MRITAFIIFILFISQYVAAQTKASKTGIFPKEGDTLNYRLVGFTVPENKQATGYMLQLEEYYLRDDGMEIKYSSEKTHSINKIIETVPKFGTDYRWRVKYIQEKKIIDSTKYYHFTTGYFSFADSMKYRARILENKITNKYLYVFVDATRILYDMNGNAAWYLPNIPGLVHDNTSIRDIKLTPFNTITFLTLTDAIEIDYDGNVLWKGPDNGKISGDSSEHYHHEFTRLNNGHYMVAGIKTVPREIPAHIVFKNEEGSMMKKDTRGGGKRFFTLDGKRYENVQFGTLIEYDTAGNIAWSWNSGDNFTDDDIFKSFADSNMNSRTHLNAFYFNEKENTIYTSYRNISRVMKIAYPSGKLLANYGDGTGVKSGEIPGSGLFYGQHSARLSKDGQLYLFNNNSDLRDSTIKKVSSIVFMTEPKTKKDTLAKTWEFTCDIDSFASGYAAGGGSVYELTDGSVLVCMASSRSFIVSRSKDVLWNMLIESHASGDNWEKIGSGYRASMIETQKQLYGLIFRPAVTIPGRL